VGVAQEVPGGGVPLRRHGDAHAGAHEEVVPRQAEGERDLPLDPRGDPHRRLPVVHPLQEDGELVAPQAGHGVAGAEAGLHAAGRGRAQLLGGLRPHPVAHRVHVLQRQAEHREAGLAGGAAEEAPRALQEVRRRGEPGRHAVRETAPGGGGGRAFRHGR
jgi:hypothetical protein